VYNLLLGTVTQTAKKGEKLLRNLIPDDPIVAAIPSYNADVIAVSQMGRWTRFPEKAIAGVGSPAMELPKGDIVAGVASLSADVPLCIITADGNVFVRESAQLPTKRTPGSTGGVLLKGFTIIGVAASPQFAVLTRRGKLLPITVAELPYRAQTATGASLPGLADDDAPLAFTAI
jgi:DNA gyrase/topoisomerase IV subunit A